MLLNPSILKSRCNYFCFKIVREVIELKDIQSVTSMVHGIWLQEGYYYFEIFYQKSKLIFATDSAKKTERWIEMLKNAISFATYYRN